jgi:hypothetical protein
MNITKYTEISPEWSGVCVREDTDHNPNPNLSSRRDLTS